MTSLVLNRAAVLVFRAFAQLFQVERSARARRATRPVRPRFRAYGGERLEGRACPTVAFAFDAGVLTVTGDDGPNTISLIQSADGAVDVTGDGQSEAFSGVDQVILNAGGGDDGITMYFNPKEFTIDKPVPYRINMGQGNDTLVLDDGASPGSFIRNLGIDVAVDLGTGNDEVAVALSHFDDVDLDLASADGGDRVRIGLLLPAVQNARLSAGRMSMQLSPGGNLVAVRTENFDNVEIALEADPRGTRSSPVTGAAASTPARADDRFTFQSDRVPGSAGSGSNTSEGVFDFTGNYGPLSAASATPSSFAISANGFASSSVSLTTGAADDTVAVQVNSGSDSPDSRLSLDVDLGAGDDNLAADTTGIATIAEQFNLGAGDDIAIDRASFPRVGRRSPAGALSLKADLGAGSDLLLVTTRGYGSVKTDIDTGPADDGNDFVWSTHVATSTYSGGSTATWLLRNSNSSGADYAVWVTVGFHEVRVQRPSPTRQITSLLAEN